MICRDLDGYGGGDRVVDFVHLCMCFVLAPFFFFLPEDSSVYHLYNVQVSFLFELLHACYFVLEIGNLNHQCSLGVDSHHGCQFTFGFLI
jgi:hypothetical protein